MAVTVQTLRRNRGLTLIDLARLSGVPARTIGAIELGTLRLDHTTRDQLAWVFAVTPAALHHSPPPPLLAEIVAPFQARQAALPFATALATAALAAALLPQSFTAAPSIAQVSIAEAQPVTLAEQLREPALTLAGHLVRVEAISATLVRGATSLSTLAAPTTRAAQQAAAPAMVLQAKNASALNMPRGCPLNATTGDVIVTQGYGEGSHAPAATWGALDFGVDADGDGYAEPESTFGIPVIATHSGIARVYPGSWPGGNFIRIEARDAGWTSAYGHLDTLLIADGQEVKRGMQIGTVGTTGYSSGPHLHYEVWQNGLNVDPTPFVACH